MHRGVQWVDPHVIGGISAMSLTDGRLATRAKLCCSHIQIPVPHTAVLYPLSEWFAFMDVVLLLLTLNTIYIFSPNNLAKDAQ